MIFDENNPDVIENSENENCNKKLLQNDTGSSQNKSYNKYKTHSVDKCVKNMVKNCGQSQNILIMTPVGKKR